MKKLLFVIFITISCILNAQPYYKFIKFDFNNIDLKDIVLNEADSWIGVKYVYGGTSRKGVDCSAFVRNVYKKSLNIRLPRTSREQFKNTKPIRSENVRRGDLIFFINGKGVHHVGIIYGDGKFIHSSSSRGVRIDSFKEGYWSNKEIRFSKII